MKLKIVLLLTTFLFLSGCQTRAPADNRSTQKDYQVEEISDPDTIDIPDSFNSNMFGIDTELPNRDEALLIRRLEYIYSQFDMSDSTSVVAFLKTTYNWIADLYVSNNYGDAYITAISEDVSGVTFVVNEFEIPIKFDTEIDMKDYPENVLESNDWRVVGHRVGFKPSDYANAPAQDVDMLTRLFNEFDRCEDKSDYKRMKTVLKNLPQMDMTVEVYLEELVFKICDSTLHLAVNDTAEILGIEDIRLVNMAFPTDRIDLYQVVYHVPSKSVIAVLKNPEKVTMSDKEFTSMCKKHNIKDLSRVNMKVRDIYKHVFAAWNLFTAETRQGFYVSMQDYLDTHDMRNGLYNCAIDDLTQAVTDPYFAVSVSYKGKSYELHITGDQFYLMIMEE